MNKSLENIENWLEEVNSYVTSKNGYPVYDLMKNSSRAGYLTASGLVFYSEDEEKLSEFKQIINTDLRKNKENLQKFIKNNSQSFREYNDVSREIGIMDNKEALAFGHLLTEKTRKETFKNGFYGASFIEHENQYLIFRSNHAEIRQLANSDINDIDNFNHLQATLKRLYQNGEIKPECIFSGKTYERLKSSMENIPFFQMDKKNKNLFEVLSSFRQSVQPQIEIVYQYENQQPQFKISNAGMKDLIVRIKDKQYELEGEKEANQHKNIADLLKEINQTIASVHVEKFISRLKM
jgi:hypothetical protein